MLGAFNSGPKPSKVGKVRTKCVKSGDRIWNKLGMKHRKKEKIDSSKLRCINVGGLMLTSGKTCTHTCELAQELAVCCLLMQVLVQSLLAARGRAWCRASAQKHGKDAYFGYC